MPDYELLYWSAPFRGQFVRAVLAYAGRAWTEGGDAAIARLMGGPVQDMPVPFMGPPLLIDKKAAVAIAQMPAIVLYLGETLDLLPATPALRALTGITHEMIVTAAVAVGMEVPPEVRRQYPSLFVEIPERFANGHFSAVERVKQALLPAPFQREPVSVADVDKFIEHAHWHLDTLRCERTRRGALNPDMGADYDRMAEGHVNDIDFYRWLRRLMDVGGVFHIPAPAASHAA